MLKIKIRFVSRRLSKFCIARARCTPYSRVMEASQFDEPEFFGEIAASSGRAILIGRRALIAFGGRPKDAEDIRMLEALRSEEWP